MNIKRSIEGGSYTQASPDADPVLVERTGDPDCNCQLTDEQRQAREEAKLSQLTDVERETYLASKAPGDVGVASSTKTTARAAKASPPKEG